MGETASKPFDVRVKVTGKRGERLTEIMEAKRLKGVFNSNPEVIEAILIEYGEMIDEKERADKK